MVKIVFTASNKTINYDPVVNFFFVNPKLCAALLDRKSAVGFRKNDGDKGVVMIMDYVVVY